MLSAFIITLVVGGLCVALGILNMMGNISSLHSYHRHRVAKDDVPAFGKLIGLGTVLIGASIMIMGTFLFLVELLSAPVLTYVGIGIMSAGIISGLVISFYAMIKYNKGIF